MVQFYSKEVEQKYVEYQRLRFKKKRGLIVHFVLWIIFTSSMAYQQYGDWQEGRVGIQVGEYKSFERMFYELPLFWLLLFLLQVAFYYAEQLPLLAKWQDYVERKEFERLKKTYEYQLKVKNENTANSNY